MNAVYVLIIQLEKTKTIKIGALGEIFFLKGVYAYVGSAQSNFYPRVKRHLSKEKKLFWHIDYLLNDKNTKINKIFFKPSPKTEECYLANLINEQGKKVLKFGSSDCKCKSHLFLIKDFKFLKTRLKELTKKHNTF